MFGWAYIHYETVKDMQENGQYCKSGLALPVFDDEVEPYAKCVRLHSVSTTVGHWTFNHTHHVTPTCFASDQGSFCTYFSSENTNL